jgi:hypothetical protein
LEAAISTERLAESVPPMVECSMRALRAAAVNWTAVEPPSWPSVVTQTLVTVTLALRMMSWPTTSRFAIR